MNPQAPTNDSDTASDLSRVQALLPLHAQGLLQGEQLTFMNTWLEHNMALNTTHYTDIKAELAWLGMTATQLKAEAASQVRAAQPHLDVGLNTLMGRIAAEQSSTANTTAPRRAAVVQRDWLGDIVQWVNHTLGIGSHGFAMGAAVLVVAQAGVIGALLLNQPAEQTLLSGASNTVAVDGVTLLTVAFKPAATELAIRQTLASASAQISSGPSALGLYTVSVATAQLEASLTSLRSATAVVESVTR